ncbi:hypothetical protein [Bacteroides acidifaciens]|uniref:Uncharacterized protein n=1 Tax=Bacteroides acidifaciens TaxID=85831 RepID=A0A4S2AZQ1_9BACE|nr:hypothetical protein [Bacteroides acidifaciens]TGY07139.1 hypothetical protein E5356_05270 [Bacteroides acidifaciens]
MKISELVQSARIDRAMQIPVALSGENRSLTLGQIIDALASSVISFNRINTETYDVEMMGTGQTAELLPVVFDSRSGRENFYALKVTVNVVSGVVRRSAVFYTDFNGRENFYDDNGHIRTNCLFIAADGRLYRYNGTRLISAGITDEQATQLKLLTPIPVASENDLETMEQAGLIVPGQMYYISEND